LLYSGEHDPVNIGNEKEDTILELAEAINRLTQNPGGLVYEPDRRSEGDPQQRRPDITRAREILNYEARVGLDEGLIHTIKYFKEELGIQ
jgi:dTDP-glucose 4,6-dehydratase